MEPFSDPEAVAAYAEGPRRLVPGFADLQRMAMLLLAEHVGTGARILILGAGGGLELRALAEARADWTFDGVDPSAEMLNLAKLHTAPLASRIRLHHGLIDIAPEGPFDAATCLLTFHFIEPTERRRTLSEVYRRLRPGAPFVLAHMSFPQEAQARARWLSRYAAFAAASGIDPAKAQGARDAISARLPILSPEEDEKLLHDAGFRDVELFYAAFTFRGWLACA